MTEIDDITKAATAVVQSQPFFGTILLCHKREPTTAIDTADIDGVTLRYNPAWFSGLPPAQRQAVLMHEACHVAGGHHLPTRRGNRNPEEWGIACDLAVNPLVKAAGAELPPDALIDEATYPLGTSAETIYADRQKKRQEQEQEQESGDGDGDDQPADQDDDQSDDQNGDAGDDQSDQPDDQDGDGGDDPDADGDEEGDDSGDGDGDGEPDDKGEPKDPGGMGGIRDYPAGEVTPAEAEAQLQVMVSQAAAAARAAGNMPGFMQDVVDDIKRGRIDWREPLRQFFQAVSYDEYSWRRPNRRYLSQDIIMPSLRSNGMGEMVVVVDTSGSCNHVRDMFLGEIAGIAEDLKPERLHIIWADCQVQRHDVFEREDLPFDKLEPVNGGGTAFTPTFDWLAEQADINPACLVYLTDLEGDDPTDPGYPVLWASVEKHEPPFGDVLYISNEGED